MWLLALAVPLTAVAFLVGILRWWVFIARSTQRLVGEAARPPHPRGPAARARRGVRRPAARDRVLARRRRGPLGRRGRPPARPPRPRGSRRDRGADGDRLVAAIVHDAALQDDRAFVDTATSYAVMTLDNHRLSAQTSLLLRAVCESRARIQTAADDERRRIERDLHDGAQQRSSRCGSSSSSPPSGRATGTPSGAASRRPAPARRRRRGGPRGGPLARARHLPRALADHGLVEGAARRRRCGTRFPPRSSRRHPSPLARGRERRVLLLPGGAPERGQARPAAPAPR